MLAHQAQLCWLLQESAPMRIFWAMCIGGPKMIERVQLHAGPSSATQKVDVSDAGGLQTDHGEQWLVYSVLRNTWSLVGTADTSTVLRGCETTFAFCLCGTLN